MREIVLYVCSKCHLEWINRGEVHCPRCRTHSAVTQEEALVAGRRVKLSAVVLHGEAAGLLLEEVRRGLDTLKLGERCSHGWITYRICPICYNKEIHT